jgi:thiol:disulfide interchange protein DsbD
MGPLEVMKIETNLRPTLIWLCLISIFAVCLNAYSQQQVVNKNPMSIDFVRPERNKIDPNENVEVVVHVVLDKPHHAYSERFRVLAPDLDWLQVGGPRIKDEVDFFDPISKKNKKGLGAGPGEIAFVIEPKAEAPTGQRSLKFELEYQACTEKYCLLPIRLPFELEISIGSEAAVSGQPKETLLGLNRLTSKEGIQGLLGQNLALAFLLVFFAGILASFTPCIYPMIPITLAVLGARDEKRTKTASLTLSLSYVLGIAVTYSLLGVFAALTGSLFGGFLGHPAVAVGLGLMFVALGLSMYGLFEITVPLFISSKLSLHKTQKGPVGAFMAGQVAGVLASPCVGPVLVGLLAFVAQTRNVGLGFALMFTFAFGMGQLFLILGTFSHLLNKVPKSGSWMDFVKFIMGSAMIALAIFYVQPVVGEQVFLGLVGLALILISGFFGAFDKEDTPLLQMKKGALLAAFVVGLLFLTQAVFPGLFEPNPMLGTEIGSSKNTVPWETFSFDKLEAAKTSDKGIVIDFYADWCLACKEMEVDTFPKPEVMALKDKFIWFKFDATETSPAFDKLREQHGILGLPWILIYEPSGKKREDLTLTGFEGPSKFSERLKKSL